MQINKQEATPVGLKASWHKRLRAWLSRYEWQVVAVIWITATVLGYVGFAEYYAATNEKHSIYDLLYATAQLFVLQSGWVQGAVNWKLDVARFMAPAATVYAAMVGIAALFEDQIQNLKARFIRNHVVICGLGRRGLLLAQGFLERERRVIVLDRDQGNELITECRARGGIVLVGDASDVEMLRRAGVHKADYLIAVTGQDGINAEIAVDARSLVEDRIGSPLKCVVQIDDVDLCRLLKGHELQMGKPDAFRLEFFNSYLVGAQALLEKHPPFRPSIGSVPRIMVIGVGRFGESLVTRMAWMWRDRSHSSRERLEVMLVDKAAPEKKSLLLLRNPFLKEICDFDCIRADVRSPEFLDGRFLFGSEGLSRAGMIYICLDNDSLSVATALALHKRLRGHGVPIVVRMSREGGVGTLLEAADRTREGLKLLSVFGVLERTCLPELVLGGMHEFFAQAICAEYLELAHPGTSESLSAAYSSWHSVPDDAKELYRRLADQIGRMLGQVGCTVEPLSELNAEEFRFSLEEEEILAASVHEFYAKERHRGGLKYLPKLEGLAKGWDTEVCDWQDCPDPVKDVYRNIVRRLPTFLGRVEFQIYRLT